MTIFAKRSNSFAERLNSFAERLNSFAEVLGLPYQHKYTNRFRTKALSSQQNRLLQTFDAFGIVFKYELFMMINCVVKIFLVEKTNPEGIQCL